MRRRKGEQQEIEPYEPNYSADVDEYEKRPAAPPTRQNAWGCFQNTISILLMVLAVVAIFVALVWYLVFRETTDAAETLVQSIFGTGEQITTVDVRQIILAVRQEAWLETVRETQALDLEASNDMPGVIPGRRSLRYQAFVTVTAGVDLEQVSDADIVADGNRITITLPHAQLKDCILDLESSRYYDSSCTVIGCGGLETVLRDQAMQAAATQERDRLLAEAWNNAAEEMQNIAESFGVEEVAIVQSTEFLGPVAEGGTCYNPTIDPLITPTPAS